MYKNLLLFIFLFFPLLHSTSKEVIRERIENILSKIPLTTNLGIIIFNPLTQDTLVYKNHTQSMIPASNTKLFTTATALSLMGGDHYLSTQILTDDFNLQDGIINGSIYIKGFGNSVFTESDLDRMITEIINTGIKEIRGNVIGDDTFFDDVYTRDDWINDEKANVKLPPISALVIDRNKKTFYQKRGRRTRRYYIDIENPPLYTATLLKDKLSAAGILIEGTSLKGTIPLRTNIIAESKVALREVLAMINKRSDNFLAECLFKTIGAVASGHQGNAFYSTQAILSFIEENGIYPDGTAVVDGSGISRFNQITAGAIAGLLEKMYFDLVNFEDFFNSLSIAGIDGTLKGRMEGTAAENNFRGKTGTLNGVSSLSGYLTTLNNEDLIVSIIMEFDRGSWNFYKNIQDEIIEVLAEWN